MTELEEIKKPEHERIWLEPAGAPDRCWCQDNQWGEEGVEYVLASTLESLQRENEGLRKKADARENELVSMLNSADESRFGQIRRAEAAEAEVKRLQAEIDRKSSMPGDHRYWEGRYRDEAAENDRLRKAVAFYATQSNWEDARFVQEEQNVLNLIPSTIDKDNGKVARTALASTGGEHHAE